MVRAGVIRAVALVIALMLPGDGSVTWAAESEPSLATRVFMRAKPAIVTVEAWYAGTFNWNDETHWTFVGGQGSGFFIGPSGYLVTNAHVVDTIRQGEEAARAALLRQLAENLLQESVGEETEEESGSEAAIDKLLETLSEEAVLEEVQRHSVVVLQSGIRVPYDIKAYGAPAGLGEDLALGKDVAVLKIETKNAPTLPMGDSDAVQIGSRIFAIGYPGAADIAYTPVAGSDTVIGAPSSSLEPTVTDGTISSRKQSVDGTPLLQTNAAISGGSSGGPAIDEAGLVIGLITLGSNDLQGFNFIVPSNTVMEFVRQAGADDDPSLVNPLWSRALEHYWSAEYTDAKRELSSIVELFPEHTEAKRLILASQEKIVRGEDRSGVLFSVGGIHVTPGVALGILALGIALAFTLRKHKKGAAPSAVAVRAHDATPALAAVATPLPAPRKTTELYTGSAPGHLVCIAGPIEGNSIPIGGGIYLGREPDEAQVIVEDSQVSGRHAWAGMVEGKMMLRDSGSTNGTFLNDDLSHRIEEVELKDGDVVTLGGAGTVKFRYRA